MDGPDIEEERGGRTSALAAFRHRDFLWFWLGALVSNIGTWMQNITVPFVVYELTRSGAWVGLAAFAGLFPGVIVGPFAGSLADRIERRKLLLWSQVVQAVLALMLWGVWEAGLRRPGLLLLLIGANGLVFGGTIPAWQAFVASLVPREELLNAITLNSAQFNGARALGPAIGGLALGAFGPSWAFLLNAISFLAVIGALFAIRGRQPPAAPRRDGEGGLLASFADGVRYVGRHSGILMAIVLVGVVSFFATPVFQLLPVVAKRVFHVGPGLYGLLAGVFGVGAVLGALVLGVLGPRVDRSRLVKWSLVVYAAGLLALGAAPVFALGVGAVLVMGVGFVGVLAVLNTTVQVLVAEHVRGRVLAVYSTLLTSLIPLGALAEGSLADRIGMRTVAMGAGAVLLATALWLALRPDIARRLDEHGHRGRL
ncbi:MAG TPA: MFS transporter, partial [Acidimicrobiales bacterium]|nr:MFS transporter [Acidimicrobiales bacterium]